MLTKKIFLASSSELKDDRDEFEIFINRKNKEWKGRGVFLELVIWEDFLNAVSTTRSQDEYDKAIRQCDIFVMLFHTKVGKYTEEEFDTALAQFRATNKPLIFTYFKDVQPSTASANQDDLMSLWAFQKKLKAVGHFQTAYQNADALKLHFNQQLERLAASGFIEFKQNGSDSPGGDGHPATVSGSGAIAQGPGATAVGAGGVYVGGQNTGSINTGTQITTGNVSGSGIAIGPGALSSATHGNSAHDLATLFAPLLSAVAQQAPTDKKAGAVQQVLALQAEAGKGNHADDGRIARIIDSLAAMVPGAVATVVNLFATPILADIAGPVTKFVLAKLKGN